jgi:hypothetical protein
MVFATGVGTILLAALLAHTKGTALSTTFMMASIISGGVTGLFGLAFLCPRATAGGAYTGILAGVLFTAWATLSPKGILTFGGYHYTFHPYLIGVFSTLLLFVVGYSTSPLFRGETNARSLTIWGWLSRRRSAVTTAKNV